MGEYMTIYPNIINESVKKENYIPNHYMKKNSSDLSHAPEGSGRIPSLEYKNLDLKDLYKYLKCMLEKRNEYQLFTKNQRHKAYHHSALASSIHH